jgi:2-polyprenyl-6-methoxyphenol hydroxylase-like FAD-dependent oxidoreductase
MADRLRVGIIGGSISGCAAAVELLGAGHDVTVFERSPGMLVSRGAGIGTPVGVLDGLIARGLLTEDFPRLRRKLRCYLCRDGDQREGRVLGEVAWDMCQLNWAHLFEQLRRRVPDAVYRGAVGVAGVDLVESGAVVRTGDGTFETFDLVVAADGYQSLGRSLVAPDAQLTYRGMVLWRGLVEEGPEETRMLSEHGNTRIIYPRGHANLYLIPGPKGETAPGSRLANWGYYLQVPASELDLLLVDDRGQNQTGSIAFGRVPATVTERFRERVANAIPPYFLDLIDRTDNTAVQAIYSAEVPAYARGRVCLVGDAGSVLPPFTGSGVMKAMTNATSLADALDESSSPDQGLSAWSAEQVTTASELLPLAESLERELVFEVPDLSSMSVGEITGWLSTLHPGSQVIPSSSSG